jgi:hypothetical protein
MTYSVDVTVIEIKADFDPFGGEYVQVSLGYKIPLPRPPEIEKVYPPVPKQILYKHALHLFIPKDQWTGQYTMWEEFHAVFKDDGTVELKKKGRS